MNASTQTTDAAARAEVERLLRLSFPPLDPNGQPLSMILRGDSAQLGDLRLTLSCFPPLDRNVQLQPISVVVSRGVSAELTLASHLTTRDHLLLKHHPMDEDEDEDAVKVVVDDAIAEGMKLHSDGVQSGHEIAREENAKVDNHISGEYTSKTQQHKRIRDCADDEEEGDRDDDDEKKEDESNEHLLLYVPSIRCTCSSWNMEDISGELFITSLRILFLSEAGNDEDEPCNDVAIAGRCIALHAVDSLPSSDGENETEISHHIYCQLAEPTENEGDVDFSPAMSMFAPSPIVDEENDRNDCDGDGGDMNDDEMSSEKDGAIEVYFKPEDSENGSQSRKCQAIFDALTKLASLNPEGESGDSFDGGGGLLSMLSLMAGMGYQSNGFNSGIEFDNDDEDDGDDHMVVRLGGSNNLVANDDDSEGATDENRQAMLRHLDAILVVPPEYEIASSNDGQFDDADEDEGDDDIL